MIISMGRDEPATTPGLDSYGHQHVHNLLKRCSLAVLLRYRVGGNLMFLDPETIARLVPEGVPPPGLVPATALILAQGLSDRPLLSRSYLWATALLNVGFQSSITVPPRFNHVSAGFVSSNPQSAKFYTWDKSGVGFGLFVLAAGEGPQTIGILDLGGQTFPVVVAYGQPELHGCPPNPNNASSTCWVKNLGTYSSWNQGILTCRHAVSTLSKGTSVTLVSSNHHSQPGSSVLAEIDECTIDAAVLQIQPSDWPAGLNKLLVSKPSAPGQQVEFEDRNGALKTGHILRVFIYSTYIGNLFGQRVIADCKGVAGDSGSLLLDPTRNEAVGIYMGTIPDGAGGRDGIFQEMSQVEAFFQLEFHY
jgi:hypothetical protein